MWIRGASHNDLADKAARDRLPKIDRNLTTKIRFDTANKVVAAKHGVRGKVGYWGNVFDYILMDVPDLMSMGERCFSQGSVSFGSMAVDRSSFRKVVSIS